MSRKYVTFVAKNEEFGIPVDFINYIDLPKKVTEIPRAPESLVGICEIRENVVPVIDVNTHLFNQGINLTEGNLARIIGVQVNQKELGLLVEEAREIIDIDEDSIQQVTQGDIQYKVANLENDRLILMTDPHELINSEAIDYIQHEMSQTTEAEEAKYEQT